jgi:small nuclear ribonucleoprotein D1
MKLIILFKKILNEIITIELKNGSIINGVAIKIDKKMNVYLKNAKKVIDEKNFNIFENICIRGSKIRLIVLPICFNLDIILK